MYISSGCSMFRGKLIITIDPYVLRSHDTCMLHFCQLTSISDRARERLAQVAEKFSACTKEVSDALFM